MSPFLRTLGDYLSLYYYVLTTNLRAKIANLSLTAKKMPKKRDCAYRGN
ncbi:hypothetical protein HMPREF9999_01731 [Alloprevotella sp. oral taxon 473 str. F0040]|nr:hypothetical protein HMPREF9999_01731 [Alloprevotella sp. oral taxon 473 str. F0040]